MTALAKRALAPLGGGANGASQVLAQYPEGQDEPKVAAEKVTNQADGWCMLAMLHISAA